MRKSHGRENQTERERERDRDREREIAAAKNGKLQML